MQRLLIIVLACLGFLPATTAWARGGGGCFPAGTPILTPSAPAPGSGSGGEVPIERLAPGDQVLSFEPDGSIHPTTVRAIVSLRVEDYCILQVGATTLCVTPDHPFCTAPGTFQVAGSLHIGQSVLACIDGRLVLQRVEQLLAVHAPLEVFNLQVDPPHTFFAAALAVHNKGGGCFAAGTPVATPGGQKPIEQLSPGEKVLAFDPADPEGRVTTTTIRTIVSLEVDRTLRLTAGPIMLRVTPDHPFYVGAGEFRLAGALHVGDSVLVQGGAAMSRQVITGIEAIPGRIKVYNLQADDPHTYFAAGVGVHNKGGGGGGGHGGGGFGGGSWGGSGYHGGSGSSGQTDPTAAFIFFIILAIFIGILIYNAHKATTDHDEQNLDFVYSGGAISPKAAKTRKLLEFIAKQDQAMAPDLLTKVALGTFLKLQECWQARAYEPMKTLLMPDLYAQHLQQIQAMIAQHEINYIASVRVDRVDLVNVRYTDKPDTREFTALITAWARDYYVDDRSHGFLRGDYSVAQFQEFWTFQFFGGMWLLREIEQSRESDVLKQENFFEAMTEQGLQSVYGGTKSSGGEAGPWTEAGAVLKSSRIDRLLNFLVQTDKMWDRDLLVERARQIFVGVAAARQGIDPTLVPEGDLFPDVAEHLRAEIASRAEEGVVVEMRNLCVRKVELLLVRHYADKSRDEYTVRISAHAQRVLRRGTRVVSQDPDVRPWVEYWTFGRMDQAWRLKEVLPSAKGQAMVGMENVDEDATPEQLQWFYSKPRAG